MKKLILIPIILLSCGKPTKNLDQKKIDTIDLEKKNKDVFTEINICKNKLKNKKIYKYFIDVDNLKYLNKLDMKDHNFIKRNLFDSAFNTENLVCVSLISNNNKVKIYEFFYNDSYAEKTLENILRININRSNNHQYTDFFKRGLIFAQNNDNKNNLTMIVFNSFLQPKIVERIDKVINKESNDFNIAFRTTGIGQLKYIIK